MCFDALDYKSSPCDPAGELLDENIKGIELEIYTSDYDYMPYLEALVDDNHLICYDNYDSRSHRGNMFLEHDCSVDYEIKLQADTNKENLKMIKILNDYGLNPDYIKNNRGTSCHIHLNRNYLRTRNVYALDIVKAGEFLGEVLFKISGRTLSDYRQWSKSILGCDINSDMLYKAREIDNMEYVDTEDRYHMINCNNSDTVELRIFSNYCSFDYNIIKTFMEISDHLIDIAEFMKNKDYSDNIDCIVDWTTEWFNKNDTRKKLFNDNQLNSVLLNSKDIRFKHQIEINNIIKNFQQSSFENRIEKNKEFIRLLRRLNENDITYDGDINLNAINYDSIINDIQNSYLR